MIFSHIEQSNECEIFERKVNFSRKKIFKTRCCFKTNQNPNPSSGSKSRKTNDKLNVRTHCEDDENNEMIPADNKPQEKPENQSFLSSVCNSISNFFGKIWNRNNGN